MIVEDEKLTMLFIKETLYDYGYEDILEFSSGQEIISTIKNGTIPNLILMDINIKGPKDGIQVATEILKLCNVPIVFMSAYNDKDTIKEVLSVSLYGFLSKPFNERELYIALEIANQSFYNKKQAEVEIEKTKIKLYENCYYNLKTENIYLNDNLIKLPYNQKVLIDTLVQNLNSLVDKEALSYNIWTTKNESESALRTVVYLLRKKLSGIEIASQSKHGYILKASYI